jgi:DNA-binding response OmpR family regulator
MQEHMVLIVDDEELLRDTLALIFRSINWRVATAANGVEALAAVERDPPSLILLDLVMPTMDGREVARELKRRGSAAPIVLMTIFPDGAEAAREIEAVGYLAKPFDINHLLAMLNSLNFDV